MDVLVTVLGIALIVAALRDIFETLFHPSGRGVLGRAIVRAVWLLVGRAGRSGGPPVIAGPLAYVAVLAAWTVMLAVGWALIFLPHLPDGFTYQSGLVPAEHDSFFDALYVSLVNIVSLGYGDIAPRLLGLRILGPVETLFGLGLLTASVSWLISIHASISRRDVFAHEVHLAQEAEGRLGETLADADPALLERLLTSFTDQLIVARRDLIHLPITFYFQSEDSRLELSGLVPFLRRLIDEASEPGRPHGLRVRAEMLRMALADFESTTPDGTLERRPGPGAG